jgi:alkyl hydroperoxide reductase subunit AhpF
MTDADADLTRYCSICDDPKHDLNGTWMCPHCDEPCGYGNRCTTCGGGLRGLETRGEFK